MRLMAPFVQCFLTGALLIVQVQPTTDGSIQARNKAVAMRVFDEIFNQGKFHVADEIYAPDFQLADRGWTDRGGVVQFQ